MSVKKLLATLFSLTSLMFLTVSPAFASSGYISLPTSFNSGSGLTWSAGRYTVSPYFDPSHYSGTCISAPGDTFTGVLYNYSDNSVAASTDSSNVGCDGGMSLQGGNIGNNFQDNTPYYFVMTDTNSGQTWTSPCFEDTGNDNQLVPCSGVDGSPILQSLSNTNIDTGATYLANGSFTDTDSTSWTATVDYGDGSGTQNLSLSGQNFSLSHQYTSAGTYTVTVKVTDNQGATGTGTAQVTVNTPPAVGTVSISSNPVQINTSVTATATLTDPDAGQTHTATANWGDGTNTATTCSVTEPNGSTAGSISCPFSGYTAANVYPVTITVSDGTAQTTSAVAYESVYNPAQSSIFTAGSQFSNPSTASPSTSGNVRFGLSYKYQGGMATGDRQFTMDFNAANLHLNATSVSSLVISNGMATLQGSGTLNGTSGYTFLVTGVNGGGIRIQITDSSNNVVYDTQPGASISATPTTSVTGNVKVQ